MIARGSVSAAIDVEALTSDLLNESIVAGKRASAAQKHAGSFRMSAPAYMTKRGFAGRRCSHAWTAY